MYFSEAQWREFFFNYKVFIGHYAEICQLYGVQQLAIGTELITADTKSVPNFFLNELLSDLFLIERRQYK
jgi:hypothetical protein